jgi:hypothetical protein
MLLPVLAIAASGCSTVEPQPQQGADNNKWQDTWTSAPPRLDGPKHREFASDHMHPPSNEGEDEKATYMLGSGRSSANRRLPLSKSLSRSRTA